MSRLATVFGIMLTLTACAEAAPPIARTPIRTLPAPADAALGTAVPPIPDDPMPLPAARSVTLSNGLRVIMLPQHGLPMVQITGVLDGGLDDAAPATAALAFAGLQVSSPVLKPLRLYMVSEYLGLRFLPRLGDRFMSFQFTAMPGNLKQATALLGHILTTPSMLDSDLANTRNLAARNSSEMLRAEAPRASFELASIIDHHLGLANDLPEAVRSTPTDEIWGFAHATACPKRTSIVVVGEFDPATIHSLIVDNLGKWTCQELPARAQRTINVPPKHIRVVNRPGEMLSQILIGGVVPTEATSQQVQAGRALVAVLGGRSGRLFRSIRDEAALTYTIGADYDYHRSFHVIRVGGAFETGDTVEAVTRVLSELGRLRDELVPPAELASATRRTAARRVSSVDALTSWLSGWSLSGAAQKNESLESYMAESIRASDVTPEQARDVARLYLAPEHLQIVIVGDAKKLKPALEAAQITPVDVMQ